MHPDWYPWWKVAREHHRHARQACASIGEGMAGAWAGHHGHGGDGEGDFGSGAFGVRRPLRFLANKLELDDRQVAEMARILNDIKTERAQAAVDDRRAVNGLADLIAGSAFEGEKASGFADGRVKSAERLRDAVVKALGRMHELLSPSSASVSPTCSAPAPSPFECTRGPAFGRHAATEPGQRGPKIPASRGAISRVAPGPLIEPSMRTAEPRPSASGRTKRGIIREP